MNIKPSKIIIICFLLLIIVLVGILSIQGVINQNPSCPSLFPSKSSFSLPFGRALLCSASIIGAPGFGVIRPVGQANGNISFVFEQEVAAKMYNVGMACTANQTNVEMPTPSTAMVYLSSNGTATGIIARTPSQGDLNLSSGQQIGVNSLKCFDVKGNAITASTLNYLPSQFSVSLWLNYTLEPGLPTITGGSNPMTTVKFGLRN